MINVTNIMLYRQQAEFPLLYSDNAIGSLRQRESLSININSTLLIVQN